MKPISPTPVCSEEPLYAIADREDHGDENEELNGKPNHPCEIDAAPNEPPKEGKPSPFEDVFEGIQFEKTPDGIEVVRERLGNAHRLNIWFPVHDEPIIQRGVRVRQTISIAPLVVPLLWRTKNADSTRSPANLSEIPPVSRALPVLSDPSVSLGKPLTLGQHQVHSHA